MKTLYLKIDDLKGFVGEKRPIESQIKVFKKELTFYKIKDDVPSGQRFEVRVPDDMPLKKTGAYVFTALGLGLTIANRKGVISFDAFQEEPQEYVKSTGIQDDLFDAMTRRQIGILRYGKTLSNKLKTILKDSDQSIKERILGKLENWTGVNSTTDRKKLDNLLLSLSDERNYAWSLLIPLFKNDLKELAKDESSNFDTLLSTVLPFVMPDNTLTPKQAENIVDTVAFKGKDLDEWLKQSQINDIGRVIDSVVTGAVIGESEKDIVKRITGDAVLDGAGGVTKITVDDLDSLTMTSANLIPNAIKDAVIQKDEIFDKVVFVAVLDSRTTPICRSLDGKVYEKGKAGYKPPLHIRCRSQLIPLIDAQKGVKRGLHLEDEKVYVGEFLGSETAQTRSDIPRGRKKEYDKWLKTRLDKDIGTLNSNITYNDWLRRQPAYFQEFVLGKAKSQLFRKGGLNLDKFVNPDGTSTTLKILAKTERQSFIDAGLDPSKY